MRYNRPPNMHKQLGFWNYVISAAVSVVSLGVSYYQSYKAKQALEDSKAPVIDNDKDLSEGDKLPILYGKAYIKKPLLVDYTDDSNLTHAFTYCKTSPLTTIGAYNENDTNITIAGANFYMGSGVTTPYPHLSHVSFSNAQHNSAPYDCTKLRYLLTSPVTNAADVILDVLDVLGIADDVNTASFDAARTTLTAEGLDLNILWNGNGKLSRLLEQIQEHVDGLLHYYNGELYFDLFRESNPIGLSADINNVVDYQLHQELDTYQIKGVECEGYSVGIASGEQLIEIKRPFFIDPLTGNTYSLKWACERELLNPHNQLATVTVDMSVIGSLRPTQRVNLFGVDYYAISIDYPTQSDNLITINLTR